MRALTLSILSTFGQITHWPAKNSFFVWGWIGTNWLFSLFQGWSRTWQQCISMGSSRHFNSQASLEQIGHVFSPSCIPGFLLAWWWCWHQASKTTSTSLSFSPFSRASCMWRHPELSKLKKKYSRGNPCPMLVRHFYFTELLETTALLCPIPTKNGASGVDVIPNSWDWHRMEFLEVRFWPVWSKKKEWRKTP